MTFYLIFGLIILVLIVLTVIMTHRQTLRAGERRIDTYQKDLLAKHYDEVQNIYHKMRGWRHDYHNHIQTMKAHLALNQMDELKSYLDMLDNDLETVDTVIKTGNIKLDAILNSKLSLITSSNIRVNAKAQVPAKLSVNEVDLCIIIGNLLDNALESCRSLHSEDQPFIRIYIGIFKKQLYLSVMNSAPEKLKKIGIGRYLTTKGGGHGFGLKRIDALVKKYDGYLNRQNEPGVFATEIMLPL
ncbi:sensor histidine kinase [Sporolactobacillus nakayamae]|uniref:Sensor_kinase_SpoOB-type, alpha-helical domain n=1 Tax=Sporolactobacillus nakayamae TaxID=269670 RepID=A0A1I2RTV9_9BACL|nr:GHKL domain-containing protein [Sporolactobacillus nakayamae]SFG43988.1 Sensor_kinase_SpoOB-type, alpha-helical domain [Sporolactobacillus nakayamae]